MSRWTWSHLVAGACLTVAALTAGCRGEKSAGCGADKDCPAGHVCMSSSCEQLCQTDTNCPRGFICDGGQQICVEGSRDMPQVTEVRGNSNLTCQPSGGTAGPCVRDAFVVSGSNLTGAGFELTGPNGTTATYPMVAQTGGTDTQVTVVPTLGASQTALAPGLYLLVAYNAAGQAQTSVQLLQGEPGPAGPDANGTELITRINANGVTGTISGDRLGVTRLFSYLNTAPVATSAGRGDRMRVRVNGTNNAGPASAAIDEAKLEELCADGDGCTLSLGATRFRDPCNVNYVVEAPLTGGECRFYLDVGAGAAPNTWALSQSCAAVYNICRRTGASTFACDDGASNPLIYQHYDHSNVYGKDGSNADSTDEDGEPRIVMSFKGGCYLAEAPADTASADGAFIADSSKGLYLIASEPGWDATGIYPAWGSGSCGSGATQSVAWDPADAQRACELVVQD